MNTAWSWPKLTVPIKKIQLSKASLQYSTFFAAVNHTQVIPWNTDLDKIDQNSPITNHKPWTFKLVEVNFCFLRGPQRCLRTAKSKNFTWLLNFRVCMVLKRVQKHNIILRKHSLSTMQQYLAMVSKFATTAAHPFCCSFCSHTRFSQLSAISTASEWKS